EGRRDSARAVVAGATDDAGRFWRAALRPPAERVIAEREWREVASRPGFGFYAVAARESLGIAGWNGEVARDGCPHRAACASLDQAFDLAAIGAADEAMTILGRWASSAAADGRLSETDSTSSPAGNSAAARADIGSGDDDAPPNDPVGQAGEPPTAGETQ